MPQLDFLLYPSMSLEVSLTLAALSYFTISFLPYILPRLVSYDLTLFYESAGLSRENDPTYNIGIPMLYIAYVTYTEESEIN